VLCRRFVTGPRRTRQLGGDGWIWFATRRAPRLISPSRRVALSSRLASSSPAGAGGSISASSSRPSPIGRARNATAMPLFLSASPLFLLPIPALILLPPPRGASYSRHPRRQPYRRRRDGPPIPPARTPTPTLQHRRAPNAAAPGPRGQEELEEAIYDFMRRSDKPGRFPTREELVAAGRADLAASVAYTGGWLSLGWSLPSPDAADVPVSSGGGHPDYPPQSGLYDRNLAPGAGGDAARWVT
jgi:hypothetical protein